MRSFALLNDRAVLQEGAVEDIEARRPLYRAALTGECALAVIAPVPTPFPAPPAGGVPWLSVVLAGLEGQECGPTGFDIYSLRRP